MLTPENKAVIYARADQKMRSDVNLSWREAIVAEVEAEVRKQDDALIRQMLEALEQSNATIWEEDDDPERPIQAAIAAAKARRGDTNGKP
jgi:hypothetical protein